MVGEDKDFNYLSDKNIVEKANLKRIGVAKLPKKLPCFKNSCQTKDMIIAEWLQNWIKRDLLTNKIKVNELLPKKADFATYLNVSVGTVQNAIRYIEDNGFVESKQRIGTLIKDYRMDSTQLRKQTSKREQVIVALKQLIIEKGYKLNAPMPSSREISKILGSAPNTTRLALEYLTSIGVVESKGSRGNKANWVLKRRPEMDETATEVEISTDTLVDQVERDLKNYIIKNHTLGDKLAPHFELAKTLKVSIKTVHDAMKRLIDERVLKAKRGRYGTTIIKMPNDTGKVRPEDSIFATAEEATVYNYEKIERHLKEYIAKNYKIGDKLPSMSKLAKDLDVSSNTVRKALQNLGKDLVVDFARGKYGGTFVTKVPKLEKTETKFKWLSVNPEHIKAYRNNEQEVYVIN